MTVTNFTHEIKARLIRLLADGSTADEVADEIGCERAHVIAIAKNHGYPDREKLGWAADIMDKNLREQPITPTTPRTNGTSSTTVSMPTPAAAREPDLGLLLRTATHHQSKRIQVAGQRAIDALAKVRGLLAQEAAKEEGRRKAAEAREEARAEVKRLEQQLANARAKLRTKPTEHPPSEDGAEHACRKGCDRTFPSPQGRSLHERRSHPEEGAA